MPFAVKDNIDVAGFATTGGCPTLTTPATRHAAAVEQLVAAGAIPIGKTNMDQFATGLVGTRSPYGACHCVDSEDHISGGSSSGSAVAVAAGVVPFALGTDTAGSGRVPAAFNGIVGVKPTRGLVSVRGVMPACPSLDCVSIFAPTVSLARTRARGRRRLRPRGPVVATAAQSAAGRDSAGDARRRACPQASSTSTPNTDGRGRRRWRGSRVGCVWCPSTSRPCSRQRRCCTTRPSWPNGWRPSVTCSSRTGRISTPSYAGSSSVPDGLQADQLFAAQHRLAEAGP